MKYFQPHLTYIAALPLEFKSLNLSKLTKELNQKNMMLCYVMYDENETLHIVWLKAY